MRWLLPLLVLGLASCFAGEVIPIDGTRLTLEQDEDVVPGSKSPDGRFAVATVYRGPTTATRIGIITADKTQFLQDIPTRSNNHTDEPYAKWLSVKWSADSKTIAVHDTAAKHSKVAVFREKGGNFDPVTVPDLSAEIGRLAPEVGGKVVSSGQVPMRWISETKLEVELRAAGAAAGKQASRKVVLAIAPDGSVAVEPQK